MLLSVIVSFKNEAANLPRLVERLQSTLSLVPNLNYELIFVNDDSTDASGDILREMIELGEKNIVHVTMSRNFGVSECVLAGFEVSKGEVIIYMDADLQDPPEIIPLLLTSHIENQSEIVHTVRIKRRGESWAKLKVTEWGYSYLEKMYQVAIPREAGDFKLLTRRVVDLLLESKEQLPFMRGLIANLGFKQSFVNYERDGRGDGKANTKFRIFSFRWLYSQLDRTLISFSDAPLKLVLFTGMSVSIFSIFGIFLVLLMKISGFALPGWTGLMSAILLLGGLQMLMLGILGLYINVIYLETKSRPIYLIDKIERS